VHGFNKLTSEGEKIVDLIQWQMTNPDVLKILTSRMTSKRRDEDEMEIETICYSAIIREFKITT
jgi:hypothetical protein